MSPVQFNYRKQNENTGNSNICRHKYVCYYLTEDINLKITCHNVDSKMNNYQLRCALAMLTLLDSAARQGS